MIFDELRLTDRVAIVTGAGAGTGREIAAAALYLASPASSWVTSVILRVDGGSTKPSFDLPAPPLVPTRETA